MHPTKPRDDPDNRPESPAHEFERATGHTLTTPTIL